MIKKLLLIAPVMLIIGLGCDYATNYDILLQSNTAHQITNSLSQAEIDRTLAIINQIAESYKLTQRTTIPKDIAHLHPIAVYRETDVELVSGNVSFVVYSEKEGRSLVININGLGPNSQNKKIIDEIINRLYAQFCSEFGEERVIVSDSPEIIKIAG